MGAELFHADITDEQTDGRMGMTKVTVAFRNFPNAPKNNLANVKICGVEEDRQEKNC